MVGSCSVETMQVTPLIKAAKHRDLVALKDAIRSGADLNEPDSQGWTPLFHAAGKNWTVGMKAIIEAGADVNHGRENGFTALFSAVISGHLEAVVMLLEAGAEVLDVQGITLKFHAQGKNGPKIIAVLERTMLSD
jgi:ankyrin repeat protein